MAGADGGGGGGRWPRRPQDGKGAREKYKVAGRLARDAWDRVLSYDPAEYVHTAEEVKRALEKGRTLEPPAVTASTLRVMHAVVWYTASFSRCWDWVSVGQLAEKAGVSHSSLTVALRLLDRIGAIEWEAGNKSRASKLALGGWKAHPANSNSQTRRELETSNSQVSDSNSQKSEFQSPAPLATSEKFSEVAPREGAATSEKPFPPLSDPFIETAATLVTVTVRRNEVGPDVQRLRRKHGDDAVNDAIDTLAADGQTFRWPSELEKALKGLVISTTATTAAPAPHWCDDCEGHPFSLDESGLAVPYKCWPKDAA